MSCSPNLEAQKTPDAPPDDTWVELPAVASLRERLREHARAARCMDAGQRVVSAVAPTLNPAVSAAVGVGLGAFVAAITRRP